MYLVYITTTLVTTCHTCMKTMLTYRGQGSGCTTGRGEVRTKVLNSKAPGMLSLKGVGFLFFFNKLSPAIKRK